MSCVLRPLPQYRRNDGTCTVSALKIRDMALTPRGTLIIPWEPGYPPFEVSASWVASFEPHVGGFWVSHEDTTMAFLSGPYFEANFTAI